MRNKISVDQMGLGIEPSSALFPTARSYRPPSWPPPRDWVCVEDSNGNVVSRWGDQIWHLWPWSGNKLTLNFGDGAKIPRSSTQIDRQNADLYRLLMTWKIWGRRPIQSANTIRTKFAILKPIFTTCSRNKILASNLSRYPKVVEEIAHTLPPSLYEAVVTELNTLLTASEDIGFTVLDANGIRLLKAAQPKHEASQTTYIPPRIWQYQVLRLKEFINDYEAHQKNIEACYSFCVDSFLKCRIESPTTHTRFSENNPVYGRFVEIAKQYGIKEILEKWVGKLNGNGRGLKTFTKFLTMASNVGLAYTLNFTFARVNEGMSFKFNCLKWHHDERLGPIPVVEGQTTKTSQDPTALWPTSPSVEAAIQVMQSVAKMRSTFIPNNGSKEDIYLMNYGCEPWCSLFGIVDTSLRQKPVDYSVFISQYSLLFEEKELLITEEDLKIALAITPTLDKGAYQIGKPWPFTWHQLRRTGAVNMLSSDLISDATLQLLLKHMSPIMTLLYAHGHTTLNLSEEVQGLIVNALYETMGSEIANLHSERFISPHGESQKLALLSSVASPKPVFLISESDAIHYEKAAREHQIHFRVTAVGACMKNGHCDGDGFSSLSDCAGGDGRAPCSNSLFDRNRASANKVRLEMTIKQIESTQVDTPRYRHLEQERRGLENYFAYIR